MERARYVGAETDLDSAPSGGVERVYFGAEFCDRRIPAGHEVRAVAERAADRGLRMTLTTPWVTAASMDALLSALEPVPPGTEVVFNDWGVLKPLRDRGFVPVLGRLLVSIAKQPWDFRLDSGSGLLRRSNLDDPAFQDFLLANGVSRVELDNVQQGYSFRLDERIRATLHIPYVFVASGRKCFAARLGLDDPQAPLKAGHPCDFECRDGVFEAGFSGHPHKLIVQGNTHFYVNREIPARPGDWNVDRVVDSPGLPF